MTIGMEFQPWRCLKIRMREPIISIASDLILSQSTLGSSMSVAGLFVVNRVLRDIRVAW
jgi:hypothetical protein